MPSEQSPETIPASPSATSATPALDISNLRYAYRRHLALAGVSFQVAPGSIHGFVGPNGAGKTTTLKILATLLKPESGRARVFGHDVAADYLAVRRRIGFMPDHFSMYRQMTVYEYLDFFAAAYGLTSAQRSRTIADVLALTDMDTRRDDAVKGLSRGMQQRLGLARVLVHDPDLLLLDEPASGLDPRARIELMEILRELRGMGKTVFISSHILSELALLCDSVTILDRGQVRYSGPMEGLGRRDGSRRDYLVTLADAHAPSESALRATPGVAEVAPAEQAAGQYRVCFDNTAARPVDLARAVIDAGGDLVSLQEDVRHLNQAFMELTQPGLTPLVAPSPTMPPALHAEDRQ